MAFPMEWVGDLEDDCTLHWGGLVAHVECMADVAIDHGDGEPTSPMQLWYASVARPGEKHDIFHSGEAGGSFTTGQLARAVCEAIMKAEAEKGTV